MKRQRQAVILRVVEANVVADQRRLAELLEKEGFRVSQTTLSRDVRELGLAKGRDREGRLRYGTADGMVARVESDAGLRRMAQEFLLSCEPTGNMVVIKTTPGNASGLAAALDAANLEGVSGTVAGDDTVLVVCAAGADSRKMGMKMMGYANGQG